MRHGLLEKALITYPSCPPPTYIPPYFSFRCFFCLSAAFARVCWEGGRRRRRRGPAVPLMVPLLGASDFEHELRRREAEEERSPDGGAERQPLERRLPSQPAGWPFSPLLLLPMLLLLRLEDGAEEDERAVDADAVAREVDAHEHQNVRRARRGLHAPPTERCGRWRGVRNRRTIVQQSFR